VSHGREPIISALGMQKTTMICLCQACFYAFNLSGPYEFSLKIVTKRIKDFKEFVNKHKVNIYNENISS